MEKQWQRTYSAVHLPFLPFPPLSSLLLPLNRFGFQNTQEFDLKSKNVQFKTPYCSISLLSSHDMFGKEKMMVEAW